MIHALANALALLPTTTQQSQQTQQLNAILQQVQHFYGEGWHSLQASNALMGLLITTALVLIAGLLGGLLPFFLNGKAEERMERQIQDAKNFTKQEVTSATERMEAKFLQTTGELKKRSDISTNAAIGYMLQINAMHLSGELGTAVASADQLSRNAK